MEHLPESGEGHSLKIVFPPKAGLPDQFFRILVILKSGFFQGSLILFIQVLISI
jgi:hypothetical protein